MTGTNTDEDALSTVVILFHYDYKGILEEIFSNITFYSELHHYYMHRSCT